MLFWIEVWVGAEGVFGKAGIGCVRVFKVAVHFEVERFIPAYTEQRLYGCIRLIEGVVVAKSVPVFVK